MAHPRAKLTVAGRRLLVERVLEQGWPVGRAAEAQDVSAATAYKWVRRWRAEGLAGLADRGCRPACSPRRLSADCERTILAYRAGSRVGRTGSAGRWARPAPRSARCCAATRCPGCGSWTGRAGRWCATSVSGLGSCTTD
jgi:transposase-like protein